MRIYTKAGDLPFETFTFPDGQPHFKLQVMDEWREATIELAITSPADLFKLHLARQVLQGYGCAVNLDIRYLLGARMDRAISKDEPFTLSVVAQSILSGGFKRIRVLDCHSQVGTNLMDASNVLPFYVVNRIISQYTTDVVVAVPDKGAIPRVEHLLSAEQVNIVYCSKERDMATGALTGFKVGSPSTVRNCPVLIIDDICDGGGTFAGLAQELFMAGASKVDLFVTHGIFSKGLPIGGIAKVYTTDSLPQRNIGHRDLTVFPISMKDMK